MATPQFKLLSPEELMLPGDFAEFKGKSKIEPPVRSSYLAIATAFFQSLIRIRDSNMSTPSWAAIESYIKQTNEFVKQIPDYIPIWDKFKYIVAEVFIKKPKFTALKNIRQLLNLNHQNACDALDIGMRLLFCVIVDKDHQYNDILTKPYVLRGNEYYLQHFCNKLRVNVLIVMMSSHQYMIRDDRNNAPLVTLFMEGDGVFSVLYHRESTMVDIGTPMTDSLEKFPFFYNPKAAPKLNSTQTPQVSQPPAKVNQPPVNREPPISPLSPQEERKSEPSSPAKDNIYKQLISHMSTVIFTNIPNYNDEILLKLLNDGAAFDSSLDNNDYARLKANLNRLKPSEPAQVGRQQCGHQLLLYKPLCGSDHCAYCLKEIIDQAKARSTIANCEHGQKISPKVAKDLENLLRTGQAGGDSPGIPKGENMQPRSQFPPQMKPSSGNYQSNLPSQMNQAPPKLSAMQQKPPAYNQPADSYMEDEVSIPVVFRKTGANTNIQNIQPGSQAQCRTGNASPNYPQSGMHNPTNQSQFATNPVPQNRNSSPAMNQAQLQQPQNQQRIPPYQGVQPAPSLLGQGYTGNPQGGVRNAPKPGIECYQCEQIRSPDDFSIDCPNHKTCNICRVQDVTQCINCGRGYSDNDTAILNAIRDSL
ncbi:unnamed protein product [Blepharisma stoltei]|uniref:Uncharacterized protein n=1 Tax=Blepharisma stoltei TaxID=1481888 RepID=A0AAU9IW68_9CILI|nr:unnamed protein product [Blepharisma stoltei]